MIHLRVLCCMTAAAALLSCGPPAPPAPPTTATGTARTSQASYSVTVNPVGPAKWSYNIAASAAGGGAASFNAVQFHSTDDITRCSLTLTGPVPLSTLAVTNPAPTDVKGDFRVVPATPGGLTSWNSGLFTLECDKTNGPINLLITDTTGAAAEPVAVGPVAGPVK